MLGQEDSKKKNSEFKMLAVVERLYTLNRFDVLKTHEDMEEMFAREIDLAWLRGVTKRMRLKMRRDYTPENALLLMVQDLMQLHSFKMEHYYATVRAVMNRERQLLSICHKAPVTVQDNEDDTTQYFCDKCLKETKTLDVLSENELRMKHEALKEIREDMAATVKCVLDIRDGGKLPEWLKGVQQNNQFNFGVRQPEFQIKESDFSKEELLAFKAMENMAPQDREKIVKKVQSQLVKAQLKELEESGMIPPEEETKQ